MKRQVHRASRGGSKSGAKSSGAGDNYSCSGVNVLPTSLTEGDFYAAAFLRASRGTRLVRSLSKSRFQILGRHFRNEISPQQATHWQYP